MAVSFVGATTGNSGSATSTSLATSFHASWAEDDIAILYTGFGGNSLTVTSISAGWSNISGFSNPQTQGTSSRGYAYYRRLQSGDTAPTIDYSGNITGGWTMLIFRGGLLTGTPTGQAGASTASGTSINIASLTGVLADSMLCAMYHARVPSGTDVPSEFTEDADYTEPADSVHATSRNTGTAQNLRFGGAYRAIASDGNYGGDTFTTDQTSSLISLHVEILAEPTAQVVEITQVSETDTAQQLAVNNPIDVEITLVTDTETAQSLSVNNPIETEVGQVSESDTAQTVTPVNVISVEITQVSETDTAQAVTKIDPIHIEIGQVSESDTALEVIVDHVAPEPFVPSYDIQSSRWARSLLTTTVGENVPALDLDPYIGQRHGTFKFTLVNGLTGQNLGEIHPLRGTAPTLSHDVSRTIKRSVSPLMLGVVDTALINVLTHRVLIHMIIGDTAYPLGRYMFANHTRLDSTAGVMSTSTLVDEMLMVDQKIERSFTVGVVSDSNTRVVEPIPNAITKLLTGLDVTYHVEPTQYFSIGSWPAGTNRGRILDTLAVDGDYLQPWFDNNGELRFIRSFDPSDATLDFDWDQRDVVIRNSISETNDVINAPNRIVVISNAGGSSAVVGTYDIPSSAPYSIDNRGFVVPDVIEMQLQTSAQASAVARNLAQRGMVYEQVDISTPPDPRHDSHNVIRWQNQNWLELSWSMTLTEGGDMRHTIRKVYE